MKVAAVQLEAALGEVDANLAACERLADAAAAAGAELIALPEFFTTGMGFAPELAHAALPPDGPAAELLQTLAARHQALVGGSFLCRDGDGQVRNAYMLATPRGIAGRHDKDLPTMWENAFYVGGSDDGVIEADGLSFGAAVCWELMRSATARRLRGRVDLVIGGSAWWSMPRYGAARSLERRLEAGNAATARRAAEWFATYVGAPVVHAAHSGPLRCSMPWMPFRYVGHMEGGAVICASDGTVLARREREEGEGFVVAAVEPGRVRPTREVPERFWLHRRGAVSSFAWSYQRLHGRRWYRRHVAPPAGAERAVAPRARA